jgi:hypothetical protein
MKHKKLIEIPPYYIDTLGQGTIYVGSWDTLYVTLGPD